MNVDKMRAQSDRALFDSKARPSELVLQIQVAMQQFNEGFRMMSRHALAPRSDNPRDCA